MKARFINEAGMTATEADQAVREALAPYRLHHAGFSDKIQFVPEDLHTAIAHVGERASTALKFGLRGLSVVGRVGFVAMVVLSPGDAITAPLGGNDTMGDATVSGQIERGEFTNGADNAQERFNYLKGIRGEANQ